MRIRKSVSHLVFLTAMALVLSISVSVDAKSSERKITTEEEFRRIAEDKKQIASWGHVITRKDGSMRGFFNGRFISEEWTWEGQYYCRDVTIGVKNLGYDCQVVTVSGNKITYIRNKGSGQKTTYELE